MNISNWLYADHSITILQKYGYYAIFLNNEFYCSCDNWKEVTEELEHIRGEIDYELDK